MVSGAQCHLGIGCMMEMPTKLRHVSLFCQATWERKCLHPLLKQCSSGGKVGRLRLAETWTEVTGLERVQISKIRKMRVAVL